MKRSIRTALGIHSENWSWKTGSLRWNSSMKYRTNTLRKNTSPSDSANHQRRSSFPNTGKIPSGTTEKKTIPYAPIKISARSCSGITVLMTSAPNVRNDADPLNLSDLKTVTVWISNKMAMQYFLILDFNFSLCQQEIYSGMWKPYLLVNPLSYRSKFLLIQNFNYSEFYESI